MLEGGDISFEDQPEFLNILGKMCSRLKTIPDSMRIETCLNGPMDEERSGGCGTVSRGEFQGRPVAIKILRLCLTDEFEEHFSVSASFSLTQWDRFSSWNLQIFRREVIAWRHLQHPNILPFIGVNVERHKLAMVSEWMDHGNINEFLRNHKEVNRVRLVSDRTVSCGKRRD